MSGRGQAAQHPLDERRLRAYRLDRVQKELVKRDYAAALLFDPKNIPTGCEALSSYPLEERLL